MGLNEDNLRGVIFCFLVCPLRTTKEKRLGFSREVNEEQCAVTNVITTQ